MTDVAAIILTKNEKLHIARCLEKLAPLAPRQVFVVDCFSDDGTQEIARNHGATVVEREWPGNQAAQFNWALEHLPIDSGWILRLDADEYLFPETIAELKSLLPGIVDGQVTAGGLPADVTSLSLSRARQFLQRRIRFGGREVELVRLFRRGFGKSTASEMDERIVTTGGRNLKLRGKFIDASLMPFADWQAKHRDYAMREARMATSGGANGNKRLYYRLPPYLRAFAYFCWRYFVRLGFLDGVGGWQWNFWQGLWYRWLVDRKIGEMKAAKRQAAENEAKGGSI